MRLCATGELVVCHDETLERLAGKRAAVRDLSLEELRRLPILAERFPGIDARIPTLAEAIEAGGSGLVWNVELKVERQRDARPLAIAAARELARLPLGGRLIVSSFHPGALLGMRMTDPSVPTAWLWDEGGSFGPLWNGLWMRLCATSAVHPARSVVRRERVLAWQRRGLLVNPWTVDEPSELRRLRACGVDGVITNVPALALQIFAGDPRGDRFGSAGT